MRYEICLSKLSRVKAGPTICLAIKHDSSCQEFVLFLVCICRPPTHPHKSALPKSCFRHFGTAFFIVHSNCVSTTAHTLITILIQAM
jgi:hypothetical protein